MIKFSFFFRMYWVWISIIIKLINKEFFFFWLKEEKWHWRFIRNWNHLWLSPHSFDYNANVCVFYFILLQFISKFFFTGKKTTNEWFDLKHVFPYFEINISEKIVLFFKQMIWDDNKIVETLDGNFKNCLKSTALIN